VAEKEDTQEISTDDRRQYDRSRLIVDVHFNGAESTGVASTKDISLGGLYMTTQTRIPVGSMLALRIPIGGDHVIVRGEVVYSNPGEGVGVKFHELSDDTRRALERGLASA
jgi:hypothetical protein